MPKPSSLNLAQLLRAMRFNGVVFVHPDDPRGHLIRFAISEWPEIVKYLDNAAARASDKTLHFHHGDGDIVAVGARDDLRVAISVNELQPLRVDAEGPRFIISVRFADNNVFLTIRDANERESYEVDFARARYLLGNMQAARVPYNERV